MNTDKEFFSVKELAELFGVAEMTIYRLIQAKKLPFYRIGRMKRIKKSDLETFINKSKK